MQDSALQSKEHLFLLSLHFEVFRLYMFRIEGLSDTVPDIRRKPV